MTIRSIEAKYDFIDEATEDEMREVFADPDPMTRMMNDIEGVIDGYDYEDVYGALAMILVNAVKEQHGTEDPQMLLGTINLHVSAAWAMLMGSPDPMELN